MGTLFEAIVPYPRAAEVIIIGVVVILDDVATDVLPPMFMCVEFIDVCTQSE